MSAKGEVRALETPARLLGLWVLVFSYGPPFYSSHAVGAHRIHQTLFTIFFFLFSTPPPQWISPHPRKLSSHRAP